LLKLGFYWFVFREVIFFVSWFWAFFHNALSPINEVGRVSSLFGVEFISPLALPLLNTLVLLTRGITCTVSHHKFLQNAYAEVYMLITVLLGVLFTSLQLIEYNTCAFTITDSFFGASLFVTTGFHGLHVVIGTIILFTVLVRLYLSSFNSNHSLLIEFSILYWHFVDVVWLFLYVFIYCWQA